MADGTITIDIDLNDGGLKSEAKSAGDSAGKAAGNGLEDGLEKGAKSGASKAESEIKSFGGSVGAILAGISFAAITAGMKELADIANEYQEDMGKLSVAAGVNNVATEAAGDAYRDMVGILGETDQSVETVNHLFALCGDNTEQLASWTDTAAGVYAQFGDSLPLEGLTEAANETAKVAQVTGPMADAINWASDAAIAQGVALTGNQPAIDAYNAAIEDGATKEDAFNAALAACANEQERAAFITESMNGAYSEAGRQYQETNADVIAYRQSQSDLNAALSGLGEALMPLVSQMSDLAAQLAEGLQPAVQWFVENLPIILPIVTGLLTAVSAFFIINTLVGIFNAAKLALDGMTLSQWLLNAAMNANPAVLIVSLIAGLIAAIIVLWNTNEEFRTAVTSIFQAVVDFVSGVISSIVNFFTVTVPEAINNMITWFQQLPGRIGEFLGSVLAAIGEWAGSMASAALGAAIGVWDNIVNTIQGLPDKMLEIGGNIVSGIWDGISGAWDWLTGKITGFADGIVNGFMDALGIHSPSKAMRDMVGKNIAAGIVVGYEDYDPMQAIAQSVNRGVSAMSLQVASGSNNQTINFNQPVSSPDQIARMMRMQQRYGLAGSY